MYKINRLILPITLLALLAAVFLFASLQRQSSRENARLQEVSAEYDARIRPLREKYSELKEALAGVENEIISSQSNHASALLLCAEPDARIEENVLSLLQNYGYVGMIAVSDKFFPGQEDCLSVSDMRRLAGEGWDVCLSLSGDTDVTELCRRVLDAGLPLPVALYCPVATPSPSQIAAAKRLSITTVISHTQTPSDADPDIWYIRAYGSNESISEHNLNQTISSSGCIALTVGYQMERDRYEVNNYVAMIRVLARHVAAGEIAVTDLSGARMRLELHAQALRDGSPELLERKAQLERELDEVERQMRSV